MANRTFKFTVTINSAGYYHDTNTYVPATIIRTSGTGSPSEFEIISAKIDLTDVEFLSAKKNGPYLDFGSYGRVSVADGDSHSNAALTTPTSSFDLNNLLSVGSSSTRNLSIKAYKSTSGHVVRYDSLTQELEITAVGQPKATKSTATVTGSVDAGSTSTVTISNSKLSIVKHSIRWSFGSQSYSTNIGTGVGSASYTIPVSWLSQIPNASSGTGTVRVTTYTDAGENIGYSDYSFTITAGASAVPTISVSSARIDNTVPAAWDAYVQGKSGITITASASGYQGSTISEYSIGNIRQQLGAFTINPISESGSVSYTVTAKDSRGKTASATVSISVMAYSPPSMSDEEVFRCLSDGTASDNGTYISAKCTVSYDSVGGKNSVSIEARYTLASSEVYSSPTAMTSGVATVFGNGAISAGTSYKCKITVTDALGSINKVFSIGTSDYTMFIRSGGNGIAFGKVSEHANALEITDEWSIYHGGTLLTPQLPVSKGGTGAATAAGARANLGIDPDAATAAMTQSVGIDSNGKLFTAPAASKSIVMEERTNSSVTIAEGASTNVTITASKTGYTLIGIVGIRFQSNGNRIGVMSWGVASSASVYLAMRNHASASYATGTITVQCLFKEN